MRTLIRLLLVLLVAAFAAAASASSLTVSAQHDVLVTEDDKKQLLRVLFADDQLLVDITLDVYALDLLPSTRAHLDELRKLTDRTWLDAVAWSLFTADGAEVALPRPAVLTKVTRQRGPAAARPVDRDTSVPMTTYRARLGFGAIPSGDYVLQARVRGLSCNFTFVVRAGNEPGLRDHYLRLKAMRTRDYAEFRRLQLERLEHNPARVDALYDLIDRALVHGTLAETRSYFDRAIASAQRYRQSISNSNTIHKTDAVLRQLRDVQRTLPDYFANREKWTMTRDVRDGHYSIRNRATGAVIRDFGPTTR